MRTFTIYSLLLLVLIFLSIWLLLRLLILRLLLRLLVCNEQTGRREQSFVPSTRELCEM